MTIEISIRAAQSKKGPAANQSSRPRIFRILFPQAVRRTVLHSVQAFYLSLPKSVQESSPDSLSSPRFIPPLFYCLAQYPVPVKKDEQNILLYMDFRGISDKCAQPPGPIQKRDLPLRDTGSGCDQGDILPDSQSGLVFSKRAVTPRLQAWGFRGGLKTSRITNAVLRP